MFLILLENAFLFLFNNVHLELCLNEQKYEKIQFRSVVNIMCIWIINVYVFIIYLLFFVYIFPLLILLLVIFICYVLTLLGSLYSFIIYNPFVLILFFITLLLTYIVSL